MRSRLPLRAALQVEHVDLDAAAAPAAQQLPAGEATLGRDDLRVGDAPDLHDVVVVLVEQLAERNVERVGERPDGVDRGVPVPAFEAGERRLRHA